MSKILSKSNCDYMPWEDRPKNCTRPIWRYSNNPITKRYFNENVDRVFNSSLIPYKNEFIGVFRADGYNNKSNIYVGHSKDGINITLEKEPILFLNADLTPSTIVCSRFDPRLVEMEGKYYIIFCTYTRAVTTSIAVTDDFKKFVLFDEPFTPNYRNGVLFPRKINDTYRILLRPCDAGNSNFGDIYIGQSKDLTFWGKNRFLLGAGFSGWNYVKIGGGPAPIEIEEGWLIFIHGVLSTCSGWIYSMGAIIVDRDDPTKILYKCSDALLMPQEDYELSGFTPNVIFPTSVLTDSKTGRMAIYYGAADTYTALAFTQIDILVDYIKKHSI